jgi:hypothetical protein
MGFTDRDREDSKYGDLKQPPSSIRCNSQPISWKNRVHESMVSRNGVHWYHDAGMEILEHLTISNAYIQMWKLVTDVFAHAVVTASRKS